MSEDHSNQERKPKSLQGLLHFCTSVTVAEDAPQVSDSSPMDPEASNKHYLPFFL